MRKPHNHYFILGGNPIKDMRNDTNLTVFGTEDLQETLF